MSAKQGPRPTLNFYTRLPLGETRDGSTSYLLALIAALRAHGIHVRVFVTAGQCEGQRPWRPWFRLLVPPETLGELHVPGYARLGRLFLRINAMRPWRAEAEQMLRRVMRGGLRRVAPAAAARLKRWVSARRPPAGPQQPVWDTRPTEGRERRWIERSLAQYPADAVAMNYAYLCPALDGMGPVLRIVIMHDLFSARQKLFEQSGEKLDAAPITAEQEMALLGKADIVVAIQQTEAAIVARQVSSQVLHVPHPVALRTPERPQVPGRVLFVGSHNPPNVHGLSRFIEEVWPAIRAERPDAVLHVVGTVGQAFAAPPPGVRILGPVTDLGQEYDEAEVCILPPQIGSGLKIKLVEAMAHGRACVSTPVGVQGVEEQSRGAVAVAELGPEFGRAVLAILADPERRRSMEQAARAVAAAHFTPRDGADMLAEAILERARSAPAAAAPAYAWEQEGR